MSPSGFDTYFIEPNATRDRNIMINLLTVSDALEITYPGEMITFALGDQVFIISEHRSTTLHELYLKHND